MDTRSYAIFDGAISPVARGSFEPGTVTNAPTNPLDAPEHARENAAVAVDLAQSAPTVLLGADRPTSGRGHLSGTTSS